MLWYSFFRGEVNKRRRGKWENDIKTEIVINDKKRIFTEGGNCLGEKRVEVIVDHVLFDGTGIGECHVLFWYIEFLYVDIL